MTSPAHTNEVFGRDVDAETRCAHWHSVRDIIAIRMFCCKKYFACIECHSESNQNQHPTAVWPRNMFDEPDNVLCGHCGNRMSINRYWSSQNTCPSCKSEFNPGCAKHYHMYFDVDTCPASDLQTKHEEQ